MVSTKYDFLINNKPKSGKVKPYSVHKKNVNILFDIINSLTELSTKFMLN